MSEPLQIAFDIDGNTAVPCELTSELNNDCIGNIAQHTDLITFIKLGTTCVFFQRLMNSIDVSILKIDVTSYNTDVVRPLISNLVDIVFHIISTYTNINRICLHTRYANFRLIFNRQTNDIIRVSGQTKYVDSSDKQFKKKSIDIFQTELTFIFHRHQSRYSREEFFELGLGLQIEIQSPTDQLISQMDNEDPVVGQSMPSISTIKVAALQRIVTYLNELINQHIYTKPWYIKMAENNVKKAEAEAIAITAAKVDAESLTLENLNKVITTTTITTPYLSGESVKTIMRTYPEGRDATAEIVRQIIENTEKITAQQGGMKKKQSSLDKCTFKELKAKSKTKIDKKKNPDVALSSLNTKTKMINFLRRKS